MRNKAITNKESIQTFKEIRTFCQACEIPHQVILTTYTSRIKSAVSDLNFYMVQENHPIKIFATAKKLEKFILNGKKEIPLINQNSISYFSFGNFKKSIYEKEICCLDINSAYPTALKSLNWINEDLYLDLMKLPKKSRLISVGMLGATKRIFNYDGKNLISYKIEEKITKGVFLDVCRYVGEVLTETKNLLKNDFLFFWVDGVYFLKNENTENKINEVLNLWKKKGFEGKIEFLRDFYFLHTEKGTEIEFKKHQKIKKFNLPLIINPKTFIE